jgi:class 3 adenylate cyclase/tetratricopeptide (TPR) repeat protein
MTSTCPSCGRESPEGFRHCGFCGAALVVEPVERRKLATLVFCDLSGSTALGERIDAEAVRSLMLTYFGEMRAALERHGGTVEKFVGDAVLAVFGVPEAHEDDALRACRAALEMQARLSALNDRFERQVGKRVALRIGVNTGEVVAGDASSRETFVTGDPVNVAARLEQAARPGEVLLGERTYRLVREAVAAEAIEPLHLRGKSEPLPAYRLLGVSDVGLVPRGSSTPFAGRGEQLRLLERSFEAAVATRACSLVTVVGEPGVGKSRLTSELVSRIDGRARVVRGRCLPYGEGITFWPVGEIVRDLAGIQEDHSRAEAAALVEAHVEGAPNARVVAAKIAQLLGLADGVATAPETEWAIRHFLRARAAEQPLIVVVEDIHWAEPTLLGLLAGLPAAITDVPILVLCLARPELLEHVPNWDVGVRLEPLGGRDIDDLLDGLLGNAPAGVRARLAQASAGNPLFAEELVAMLADDGTLRVDGGVCTVAGELAALELPASLHALLSARLDRLDADARATLASGAVEGEVFHSGAVVELSGPAWRPTIPASLQRLVDKDLLRAAAASFVGETAFRFKHILVRDAAYRETAKRIRAGLHEHFAEWLERMAGDRVTEYEEVVGYHLEQSHRYRVELGAFDDGLEALGARAAGRLATAGRRAIARGDVAAATNLLGRAAALYPENGRERVEVLLYLVEPLAVSGSTPRARELAAEAVRGAEELGDERLATRARIEETWLRVYSGERPDDGPTLSQAERSIPILERARDDTGVARACEVAAMVHYYYGRLSDAAAASERGFVHADRAHDTQQQGNQRLVRTVAAQWGFTPLDRVEEMLEGDLAWARETGSLGVEAKATLRRAVVRVARGDPAGGQALFTHGLSACADLGMSLWAAGFVGCWMLGLTDDPEVAEPRLRESYDALAAAGRRNVLSTVATIFAECRYRQARYGDSDDLLDVAADAGAEDDFVTQVRLRAGRAKLLARRGLAVDAEAAAREAVALAERTEYIDLRGDSLLALGEVLRLAGRRDEAAGAMRAALELWEAKGNVASAARTRSLLAEVTELVQTGREE